MQCCCEFISSALVGEGAERGCCGSCGLGEATTNSFVEGEMSTVKAEKEGQPEVRCTPSGTDSHHKSIFSLLALKIFDTKEHMIHKRDVRNKII